MADAPDNLVLQMLRHLDAKFDHMAEDIHDLKVRVTHVVENLGLFNRRMDRFASRLDRIERRLELADSVS